MIVSLPLESAFSKVTLGAAETADVLVVVLELAFVPEVAGVALELALDDAGVALELALLFAEAATLESLALALATAVVLVDAVAVLSAALAATWPPAIKLTAVIPATNHNLPLLYILK